MNFKKLLALMLSLIMCLSLVPVIGAESAETEAVDTEKRIEQLLDFSSRIHDMESRHALKISRAESIDDPFANARIIVKYAGELDYTGSVAHVNGYNDWHVIQYSTPAEAEKAAAAYKQIDGVKYAAPDAIMSIAQEPHTNSFLSWGYGPNHVDAFNYNEWILDELGDVSNLPEIVVGIIDTGIDPTHPFLASRVKPNGYDFVNDDNDPYDDHYHGTHVAGTVVDGTLPNVKVMGIKCLDADGYGDTMNIVNAFEYANLHGCLVANASLRGPRNDESFQLYTEVINNGTDNGTVYCVASGNDGSNANNYVPGSVERAFTVAAHDNAHLMAYFSNTGTCVDITAPGVDINSCQPGGGYQELSGTSMATPHVAAACALVKSYYPQMDPDDVINVLKGAAIDEGYSGGGTGRLNVTDLLKFDYIVNGEGNAMHFISGGTYPWATDANSAYSTNNGVANSQSVLTSNVELDAYQQITFEYKVSSEQNHDYFRFKADGETLFETNGETGWQTCTVEIPGRGRKALTWEFIKDASGNAGSDNVHIRNVVLSETVNSVINDGEDPVHFNNNGSYPWIVDGNAAKSGNPGVNNSVSELVSDAMQLDAGITFMFNYKTSCGAGDKFQFLVNGNVQLEANATTDWTYFEYELPTTGSYVFTFRYVKDGSGATGSDCAWVKGVNVQYTLNSALNVTGKHLTFESTGNYPWVAEGTYARSSNQNVNNSESNVSLTLTMEAGDQLNFRYKVSSESNYDKLRFIVNGTNVFEESGNQSWRDYSYTAATNGTYTFTWSYKKDVSVSSYDDTAYLDDVEFIQANPPAGLLGDSNDNGTVEVMDALLALRYAMGLIDDSELNLENADVDGNGSVLAVDATMILRMALGLA